MTFGEESEKQRAKFEATVLPPGGEDKPTDEVVGLSAQAPEVDPAESAPRSAQRQFGPSTGRETSNRSLRPRHRQVIRRYFDSEE